MVGLMDPSYEEIFNNSNQFVGVLTLDGTVRAANDTILRFTGSNRKELIGTKLWNVPGVRFSETVQRQVRADVRKAVKGESVHHELTIQGADRKAVINFSNKDGFVVDLRPYPSSITFRGRGGFLIAPVTFQRGRGEICSTVHRSKI